MINKKLTSNSGVTHSVQRRSTEEDGWLPSSLEFTFDIHGDTVQLRLHKSVQEDTSAPVYIVHNGKMTRLLSAKTKEAEEHALYQDVDKGASILVSRRPETKGFSLTGTYVHDGEEFSIQPIKSHNTNTVDHRISKININEALLSHDVIHFGSSLTTISDDDDNDPSNITQELYDNSSQMEYSLNATRIRVNKSQFSDKYVKTKKTDPLKYDSDDKDFLSENRPNRFEATENQSGHGSNETLGDVIDQSDENKATNDDSDDLDDEGNSSNDRVKRQAARNYVVEMLIVVDYGVYEVWYNGVKDLDGDAKKEEALKRIKQYYSFVINGVDLRYKSVARHADYSIDVTWAGIIIFDTPVPDYWANTEKPPTLSRDFVESSAALEAFRAWAESQGTDLPPSDHVMLFTGHNLTYGGSVSNAGLAYIGSACNPDYYYSIVEEYFEFRDVAIAAHELGHSLGARHDMDGNTCLSFDRYIMTSRFKFPSLRKAKNPWLFSSCSVEYFTDFIDVLDRNDTNCLIVQDVEPETRSNQPFMVSQPGQVYSGDDFCKIGEGADSYICREQHINSYENICYAGLYCRRPSEKKCEAKLPPNGMTCANKKWCLNGTCIQSELAPATSDECPFGDEPGLIGGKTCAQRMLTSRYDCYRDAFRGRCCASCRRYRRNLPGCEYGDMFELCKKEQCTTYEEEYARENCCDTCAELFYTISTTVTTTATTVTEPISETTTRGAMITGNGNGKEKSNEKTNPSEEKEKQNAKGANEREETDGGKSHKRNNKDRSVWRRNEIDSDESDESEYRPRYYSRRHNTRYRERNQRRLNALTNDRLIQIKTLLSAMKRARDNSRLQRMRFLMYILDKTGYDYEGPVSPQKGVEGTSNNTTWNIPREPIHAGNFNTKSITSKKAADDS